MGFLVRWAENGKVAIDVWEEWRPQLILMDIHMPVMDGLEATRRIKSRAGGKETVIIVITADVLNDGCRVCHESEADGLLSKPCAESELLEVIRTHLGLTYVYETETTVPDTAPTPTALSADQLSDFPPDLIRQLRDATLKGDKTLMTNLIQNVEACGSADCALGLQALSDVYQYDRLNEVLEQAVQRAQESAKGSHGDRALYPQAL